MMYDEYPIKITNTDLTSLLLRSILGSKVSRGYVIILTRAEMPLSGVSPVVDDPTVVVLDVLDNLSLVVDVARCRHDHLQHHHLYLIVTDPIMFKANFTLAFCPRICFILQIYPN